MRKEAIVAWIEVKFIVSLFAWKDWKNPRYPLLDRGLKGGSPEYEAGVSSYYHSRPWLSVRTCNIYWLSTYKHTIHDTITPDLVCHNVLKYWRVIHFNLVSTCTHKFVWFSVLFCYLLPTLNTRQSCLSTRKRLRRIGILYDPCSLQGANLAH
jgi:hypothetical protein